MFVIVFLALSVVLLFLFFLNKLRVTHIDPMSILKWINWYALFLVLYFVLSSNSYYVVPSDPAIVELVNLSVLVVISFGMIIYVNQFCVEKARERKLQEMAVAYALLENEARRKDAEMQHQSFRD